MVTHKVKIIDKMPIFKRSLEGVLDDAFREGARLVLEKAKNRAPYKKGGLRGMTEISKLIPFGRRVSFNVEYALYQEMGRAGNKVFKNYTTQGTGAHFLKDAGDQVRNTLILTIRKHTKRAKA